MGGTAQIIPEFLHDAELGGATHLAQRQSRCGIHKKKLASRARFARSLPYCIAAGLIDGMVTPLQFREERVLDKALIPIMDKVKVVPN